MVTTRGRLVVGNWKMNGSRAANSVLLDALKASAPFPSSVAVCVPAPFLRDVAASLQGSHIAWGAQDCSSHASGAFTGEVSAAMLAEFGCGYVIVGHSERRAMHGESDLLVAEKAVRALASGLVPIVCVGETLAEREAGRTEAVVSRQLGAVIELLGQSVAQIVLAYEPVWAIGTGEVASPDDAQEMAAAIRAHISGVAGSEAGAALRILYGGSVKGDNIASIMAERDVDGALVGGASLDAGQFAAICRYRELASGSGKTGR